MRIQLSISWKLVVLVALVFLAQTGILILGQMDLSRSSQLYIEDFDTFTYRDTATTAEWDVLQGALQSPFKDGVEQRETATVCDDLGNTVVVWRTYTAIYAHKYDADGNPLWMEAIKVNVAGLVVSGPTVALDSADNAMVVWHDERNGDWDVYAQKLSSSGVRLWVSDKLISVGNSTAPYYPVVTAPTISADGNDFFVAWHDYRAGWDIYAQRLDSNGNRLWAADVRVNQDNPGSNRWPHAAAANGRFTVAWTHSDTDQLYAQLLDSSGTRQWSNDVQVNDQVNSSAYNHITMNIDGSSVIAWTISNETFVQRLSATGERLWSNDWQPISGYASSIGLASLGNGNTILVWKTQDDNIYAQQLAVDSSFVWAAPLVVSDFSTAIYSAIGVAVNSTNQVSVAWIDDRTNDQDPYLQRFTADGQLLWQTGRRVNSAFGVAEQTAPGVATGDEYRLVTWADFRNNGDVYIQKISDNGTRLWSNNARVNTVPGFVDDSSTAVALAADGSSTVVWIDKRNNHQDVYVQRIDANGNRLWVADVQVNKNSSDWTLYLYVAIDSIGNSIITWWSSQFIYVQKLDSAGNRLWSYDTVVHYHGGGDYGMAVDNAGHCVITWWEYRHGNWPEPPDIFVQKIDTNGTLLWDYDGIEVNLNSTDWHLYPDVATDNSNNIWIAWENYSTTDGDIYLQRLNENGVHLWGSDVLVSSDSSGKRQELPKVEIDGNSNAIVVWKDYRNDPGNYSGTDIYAQRISLTGTRLWGADARVNRSIESFQVPLLSVLDSNISIAWRDVGAGDPNIYTQRLTIDGNQYWGTDLDVVYPDSFYFAESIAQSRTIDNTDNDITEAILTAQYVLRGGSIDFYLTNDGGVYWTKVIPGTKHIFTTAGSDLRWKAVLAADPIWQQRAPIIDQLRIEYQFSSASGDDYEMDDSCTQAQPIAVNGAVQQHTFHQYDDADWVWFEATAGKTFIIQTMHTGTNADTVLGVFNTCGEPPAQSDDNAFSPGSVIAFQAPTSGTYYVKVSQHDAAVYGEGTDYQLSVRTQSPTGAVIIVAGRMVMNDAVQPAINSTANLAYRTFLENGFSKESIYYLNSDIAQDADNNSLADDVDGVPTKENIRDAIQTWARARVGLGIPLWVYLMDHGEVDRFYNEVGEQVGADELNLWLSNLEASSGCDQITVIIEACFSGSFIDTYVVGQYGTHEISGPKRVVVSSSSSRWWAYSPDNASPTYFSAGFFRALGQSQNVWSAFLAGRAYVESAGHRCGDYAYSCQRPWLDDTGDAWFDSSDGQVAQGRGLAATFGGVVAPYIDWVEVGDIVDGQATIRAQVRDNGSVARVWARVFAPSFEPPTSTDGSIPVITVPERDLGAAGSDVYEIAYDAFTEEGAYQVVVYAMDDEGNVGVPRWVLTGENVVYLPLVLRSE